MYESKQDMKQTATSSIFTSQTEENPVPILRTPQIFKIKQYQ